MNLNKPWTNDRGHVWKEDEYGIDSFAGLDSEEHNGPRCINCGYFFCQWCDDGPQEDCPKRSERETAGDANG